jgi:predicted Zn-dependent peptidase
MLIEKQAILEVLLDSRAWGEKYIANPFPYIEKDITKIPAEDLKHYKKTFYINLRKY